jgi:hypothetical protein
MSVANPRTRLISFRLSEQEYVRLQALCATQGARSLADFVRESVCWAMENCPQRGPQLVDKFPLRPSPAGGKAHTVFQSTSAARPLEAFETLANLLLELQWKAESLDQEIRDMAMLLSSADPRAGREVAAPPPAAG